VIYERDYDAFRELMADVAAQYKTEPMKEGGLQLMFAALSGVSLPDVIKACGAHIKTSRFFPRAADILQQIEGTVEDRARNAFLKLVASVERYGRYDSVRFGDPRTHYALERMGGWIPLCEKLTSENMPFIEKDFVRWYADAERIGVTWETPGIRRHFPGFFELDNTAKGRLDYVPAPKCLDDPAPKRVAIAAPERPALEAPLNPEDIENAKRRALEAIAALQSKMAVTA
jgi:hypothetical protein